jgi:hypothetical protein
MTDREYLREHWMKTVREHNRPYKEDELVTQVEASLDFLSDREIEYMVESIKRRERGEL